MEEERHKSEAGGITEEEVQWILGKRPLIHNEAQLLVDYGVHHSPSFSFCCFAITSHTYLPTKGRIHTRDVGGV